MTYAYREAQFAPIELKGDEADPADIVTKAIADLQGTVDERLKAVETKSVDGTKLSDRLDKLEARLNRPATGATVPENEGNKLETKSFEAFMRRGKESLSADEVKMLRVAIDTAGGYLAPDQFSTEILRDLVQFSPLRQAARVSEMSAATIIIPKRTQRIAAKWVGEIEPRPATEPAYGQLSIDANEMACYVDVSNQLLEDAAVDIAAELRFDFAEEFGRLEGEAFVAGDGVKKPLGILADPTVPVVGNGDPAVVDPDSLIRLMYALPSFYRNRGSWLLNGTSITALRLLKSSSGAYIWQESIAEGQPATLFGRPVVEAVDMPDAVADAFPIAFGDFSMAFRVYDRVGMSILRDPYSLATVGQTRFHARRRVGAGVVRPEAIRKLKMVA